MVESHTFSLAYVQRRSDETEPSDGELCSRCHEGVDWSEFVCQRGLYSITGVDWLIAAGMNFSSTTALRFADLEGLPSKNTMGLVNVRPSQDVKLNHDEGN